MMNDRLPRLRAWFTSLACVALWSCASTPPPTTQPLLVGTVTRVVDGDTLKVQLESGPVTVRLDSIDTPEHDQPWGPQAAEALGRRVAGRQVGLEVVTQDHYERLVAVVYLGDANVNAWLVQHGDAWAYRQYLSDDQYCVLEDQARTSRRGLWSLPPGSWRAPWEWRAAQRGGAPAYKDHSRETAASCIKTARRRGAAAGATGQLSARPPSVSAPTTPAAAGPCLIKGNISDNGRIYHVPGSSAYDQTRVDTAMGEQWFCTVDEALKAGWRAPR